jgi:hypothetical protein
MKMHRCIDVDAQLGNHNIARMKMHRCINVDAQLGNHNPACMKNGRMHTAPWYSAVITVWLLLRYDSGLALSFDNTVTMIRKNMGTARDVKKCGTNLICPPCELHGSAPVSHGLPQDAGQVIPLHHR